MFGASQRSAMTLKNTEENGISTGGSLLRSTSSAWVIMSRNGFDLDAEMVAMAQSLEALIAATG